MKVTKSISFMDESARSSFTVKSKTSYFDANGVFKTNSENGALDRGVKSNSEVKKQ
jgi:hypothetical protein